MDTHDADKVSSGALPTVLRLIALGGLMVTGILSVVYWALLISVTVAVTFGNEASLHYSNAAGLNHTNHHALTVLSTMTVLWGVFTIIATGLLMWFGRRQQLARSRGWDTLVGTVVLVASVLSAQHLVHSFITQYLQ